MPPTAADGVDTLHNFEQLHFADGTLSLDQVLPPTGRRFGWRRRVVVVSIMENSTAVTTVTATDLNAAQTLGFSITGGADAAAFHIDATSGALSFIAAPNFEAPIDAGGDNVYDVMVQVSDGLNVDTQSLAVTVTNVNEAPVAHDDSYGVAENGSLTVSSAGVLGNDTDPENDPFAGDPVLRAVHGSLALNADGSFTYTPDADYNGTDTFTYNANDGQFDSNLATVQITVSPGEIARTVYGTSHADLFIDAPGFATTYFAGNGNDIAFGGDAAVTLNGENGNDFLSGGSAMMI